MLLHARALANEGVDVDLIGFDDPHVSSVPEAERLRVWALPEGVRTDAWTRMPYLMLAGARGLSLLGALTRLILWGVPRPDLIVVQNPPGVPVLFVAWLAARLRAACFIIDWHNLTWSMVGKTNPCTTPRPKSAWGRA
jgi:beta-1,4-mannosyltransferase